jgi:endonuclease-3 related protein
VTRAEARWVYARLLRRHGPQGWWPARTAFEVMVGAVLTQNTSWRNVERAIAALRGADALSPEAILALPPRRLAGHLRPSGYFNVKARRLQSLCAWVIEQGGVARLRRRTSARLRAALLGVHGIGPETADDILLYAFGRPVFVIDAYTRRLFGRLGLLDPKAPYEALRSAFEQALGPDTAVFNEYHALIVAQAKYVCAPRPRCTDCPLAVRCPRLGV